MTTVKEILVNYIQENNYDGLYSEFECACDINDLASCDQLMLDCTVGYKQPCDCGEHDFHIGAAKLDGDENKDPIDVFDLRRAGEEKI